LEGANLEEVLTVAGPLPAGRVVHILRQVCASLAEAHTKQVVHRDIKPANIHIGRVGIEEDFVKVLDFGIAKRVADRSVTTPALADLVPGTPAYMAPEIALGNAPAGSADVYAVGCLAYYLLTRELVFDERDGLAVLYRRMKEEPLPPSQRTGL